MISFLFKKWLISFLVWRKGGKIKKAETKEEIDQARALAWEVYVLEEHYIDSNFFPKKIFEDDFDKHSIYFLALDKNKPIGTVRLVFNSNLRFPIEKLYTLKNLSIKRNKIAEISRLIVKKGYREKDIISLGLTKKCFEESLINGIEGWYAFFPIKLKKHFEKYGIKFTELQYQDPTPQQQKNREPYRFYFQEKDPKPYFISLKALQRNFSL